MTVKTDEHKMDAEDSMVAMFVSRCVNSISSSFKNQQNLTVKKKFSQLSLDDFLQINASAEDFLHPVKD